MGHYLHDSVSQTYYPPLWGDSTYPTVGTAMLNPSWSSTIKLTQTLSPNLLNETAFLYSGNTIHLTLWVSRRSQQAGRQQASSRLGTTVAAACPRSNWERPTVQPGVQATSPGRTPLKVMRPGTICHGTRECTSSNSALVGCTLPRTSNCRPTLRAPQFSTTTHSPKILISISYSAMLPPLPNYSILAGKHWVQNNYGFYVNDNYHVIPRLTLNLGLRFDALPHTYERYNQFANFVPSSYNTSSGLSSQYRRYP